MTHVELAKLINTLKIEDSKAQDFMGKNCRCPSLVPGTLYILKEWTIIHHINSNNPFMIVEFIGSGNEENGVRTMYAENPAIKTMKEHDRYFFKAINAITNEPYEFSAYMSDNCVCIGSGAVRITCFAVLGHESPGFDATPKTKVAKSPKVKTITSSKKGAIDILDDDVTPVIDEEDDGLGCKDAWLCHPISLRPLRLLHPNARK